VDDPVDTTNPHFSIRKSCPVCDGMDRHELFKCSFTASPVRDYLLALRDRFGTIDLDALEGADYVLQDCRECGLIYQSAIPDEHLSARLYEAWIDAERSRHRAERNVPAKGRIALEIMGILDFLGRDPRTLRFMDFGMGWGSWCRMADAFGVECYGVEVSGARIDYAAERGVRVLQPDDIQAESYDFINTEQVFEHLPDPLSVALTLARALRPGGILKISVPNAIRAKRAIAEGRWTAPYGSRWSLDIVAPLAHLNAFTHRPLTALGARAGLTRVTIPARLRYRYAPTWEPALRILKRTAGLHYRAIRRQDTTVWFTRPMVA
jgi:2-polyprenyl-3-methyl-5-hydroxy-6-metoxy-1,4-benzoquinol methylase